MKRLAIVAIMLAMAGVAMAQEAGLKAPPPPSDQEQALQYKILYLQQRQQNLTYEFGEIQKELPKAQAELKKLQDAKKPAPAPTKDEKPAKK